MMKENSPIGVAVRPVRSESFSGVPKIASPAATASGRASSTNAVTPKMSPAALHSCRGSICMPMATKNTALKISLIPENVRSTWCRCGVSATITPSKNAPSASEYPASCATTASPNSSPPIPSVCSSSSAEMLIRFSSHGTSSRPAMPASTTNAPSRTSVSESCAPWLWSTRTIELSSVSITTATTSSSTATPIASCPGRSWLVPVSCKIFPMIADDDTIRVPARNRPSRLFHPSAIPNSRDK